MRSPHLSFTSGEVATYYAVRVPHLRQRRAGRWRGRCPLHNGKGESFCVDPVSGLWFCFSQCVRGGDLIELEIARSGADFRTALAAVLALVGRPMPVPVQSGISRDEWTATREAQEREKAESDEATYFAGAAILLLEGELERLPVDSSERRTWTHILDTLKAEPVTIYRIFARNDARAAASWVQAGLEHERRVHLRLGELIMQMVPKEISDAA